jgi:hypothetical protein
MADDRKLLEVVQAEYKRTGEFIDGITTAGATIRGLGVTIWLAFLGIAFDRSLWELGALAAVAADRRRLPRLAIRRGAPIRTGAREYPGSRLCRQGPPIEGSGCGPGSAGSPPSSSVWALSKLQTLSAEGSPLRTSLRVFSLLLPVPRRDRSRSCALSRIATVVDYFKAFDSFDVSDSRGHNVTRGPLWKGHHRRNPLDERTALGATRAAAPWVPRRQRGSLARGRGRPGTRQQPNRSTAHHLPHQLRVTVEQEARRP